MLVIIVGPPMSGRGAALRWLVSEGSFEPVEREMGDSGKDLQGDFAWTTGRMIAAIAKDAEEARALSRMPLSFLLAIDAPLGVRWDRAKQHGSGKASMEDFVAANDLLLFGDSASGAPGIQPWMDKAHLYVLNNSSLDAFHAKLASLRLTDVVHARPSWDNYFMRLAILTSRRTNCMKRAVGAVIVKNNRVVSTGYNGTPSGVQNCNEGGCARCNTFTSQGQSLGICVCLHAEENAIIEAGASRCAGGTLYSSLFPCLSCTKQIMQAGIVKVVYALAYVTDDRAQEMLVAGAVKVERCAP